MLIQHKEIEFFFFFFVSIFKLICCIFFQLYKLIDDKHGRITDAEEENFDLYEEIFGRRHNFRSHAVIAAVSYLVFGLLLPIKYGSTFRKSTNIYYKLLNVAAVSFSIYIVLRSIECTNSQTTTKQILYQDNVVLRHHWSGSLDSFFCYG